MPEPVPAMSAAAARPSPHRRGRAAAPGTVDRLPSRFGTLIVFDDGPWRCLAFNTRRSVQSCRHRQRRLDFRYEYVSMMLAASLAHPSPRRVALLGLGGAALPQLLRVHRASARVDTVEIDPAVVTAARRYFGYRPRKGERVFVEDAARFIRRPGRAGRYDLVLVDCYGEDFIPPALQREGFIRGLSRLLTPGGVIVANLWQTHARYDALVRRYAAAYPHVWVMPGRRSGNAMLIASRGAKPPFADKKALVTRGRRFEARSRTALPIASHLRRLAKVSSSARPRPGSRPRSWSRSRAATRHRPSTRGSGSATP